MNIRWIRIKNETEFQEIETMKKRIWNQLKKAAVLAALAGIVGNCVASASEFSAQEEQKVLLKQSAQWTEFKVQSREELSLCNSCRPFKFK